MGCWTGVVGFDGSCWHTIDPATVLITSHLTLNLPSAPLLAANEYLADDVNKFADLAARPHPVGVLSQATNGQPQRSLRWQEMLRPNRLDASYGSPSWTARAAGVADPGP